MKQVLIALGIIVILGGGYYLWQGGASVPAGDAMMEGDKMEGDAMMEKDSGAMMEPGAGEDVFDALISYTNSGYEPSSTTIKKGQTVRFVNNSDEDTWPASAVHPTHSVYPEKTEGDCLGSAFDSCRGLKPGEFWEFTFNEVGEWRFHDHIHPSKTGVVVVQ